MSEEPSLRVINDSGYPLQIAIHRSVDEQTSTHGWSIRYSEHHWSSPGESRTGFADLVVVNQENAIFAVVECKRVRETEWLLFNSDGQRHKRRHAQAWLSQYSNGSFNAFGWAPLQIDPACPEVHFCALRGQATGAGPTLLERTAADVALATECIAREHKNFGRKGHVDVKVFFPVIVTTARLRLATFDSSSISLNDGTMSGAEFHNVPFVRFRKQLGVVRAESRADGGATDGDLGYLKESTVFVVQATAINEFLANLQIQGAGLGSN